MGDIIFSEGDIGTDMYIIQSGTVELLKAIGGETRVLSTLEKGDFFGEMSVLEDVPRTASARAKTDVELVRINGATFDAMLKSNTEIAVRMMRKLSRRLREVTAMLEEALGRRVAGGGEARSAQGRARSATPAASSARIRRPSSSSTARATPSSAAATPSPGSRPTWTSRRSTRSARRRAAMPSSTR